MHLLPRILLFISIQLYEFKYGNLRCKCYNSDWELSIHTEISVIVQYIYT